VTTSTLSVIGALLVRQVFDKALFVSGGPDLGALCPLVAAPIAIPIINGVLNVVQVYLTEVVGNRVLQELRDGGLLHWARGTAVTGVTAARPIVFDQLDRSSFEEPGGLGGAIDLAVEGAVAGDPEPGRRVVRADVVPSGTSNASGT
jgi:hypothetical protein